MDAALLRERELFKKRALATPTVEKKLQKEPSKAPSSSAKKPLQPWESKPAAPKEPMNYKTMTGSSNKRFAILTKIVNHMKDRHLQGEDHPLSVEEILDETNQLDIGSSNKNWLITEALPNNPKLEQPVHGRYQFKPLFKVRDGKSLLRLLKQHDLKGLGGILLDDVQESLPNCDKVLKARAQDILFITRPIDKKKILFYNDKSANFAVDEEFQKLWRSVTVDAMDDNKIEEYLEKQGIRSMQDHGIRKPMAQKRKKASLKKRQFKRPRDNEHLADILETYEDNTITQKGDLQANTGPK
ncbi:transcription initiation factor IIE subunit beta [Chironomus tepperi]|uniref:transcription initiation factor IIE subunit beta n=1 Tax=Chironomus tepperi TaxID=113505 RepID=UPI00391F14FC